MLQPQETDSASKKGHTLFQNIKLHALRPWSLRALRALMQIGIQVQHTKSVQVLMQEDYL
jgi:hypothetical protein